MHLSMSWFFRIVALVPIAYTISAFVLGYTVVSREGVDPNLQLGVLLTLILSSTAVIISVTISTLHYWTHWKIRQQELDSE